MYDLILRNARIVDGKHTPAFVADLAIEGGIIREIAPRITTPAQREYAVDQMILAPGFIDIHTHSETVLFSKRTKPRSKLFQGVTTEMVGNCGISSFPLSDAFYKEVCAFYCSTVPNTADPVTLTDYNTTQYAQHVMRCSPTTNYGVLIGHGTLRGCVMGLGMGHPSAQQLAQMQAVLEQELIMGAFGLSLGLIYPPSSFSETEELVSLAKVLQRHHAILAVHLRNEGPKVFEAVDEMLEIARRSGVHLQISHLKLMGKEQWGLAEQLLKKLADAREEGLSVTCDQYPYPASSTGLSALAPGWASNGGVHALVARLREPTTALLQEIKAEMERRGGADCVMVISTHGHCPDAEGKTIAQLATSSGQSPEKLVAHLLHKCEGVVNCIYFSMSTEDMLAIMRDLSIAVGSDGCSYDYDAQTCSQRMHPRNFGTFPRFFQTVREHHLLTLEEAVYKVSGLPASILGLSNRGIIAVGQIADLTLFDWNQITDRCTYLTPAVRPDGILSVFVRGVCVLENGRETGACPGSVLLHQSH